MYHESVIARLCLYTYSCCFIVDIIVEVKPSFSYLTSIKFPVYLISRIVSQIREIAKFGSSGIKYIRYRTGDESGRKIP